MIMDSIFFQGIKLSGWVCRRAFGSMFRAGAVGNSMRINRNVMKKCNRKEGSEQKLSKKECRMEM